MTRNLIVPLLLAAVAATPSAAGTVKFDWAYVGNAGNAPEPQLNFGSVAYNYAISKHEVTNAQYVAFLNAVDPSATNELSLYDPLMTSSIYGGIVQYRRPLAEGPNYLVKESRENNPVNFVNFLDAIRFVNWLHNGQGPSGTETGAYNVHRVLDGSNEVRSADARVWIPSIDEWYKAAYHNPASGVAATYFAYATGSNNEPVSDDPNDNPSGANYFNDDHLANGFNDGYAVGGASSTPPRFNPLTDVGAYADALSPYGTFDQEGNVGEWLESAGGLPGFRYILGSAWNANVVPKGTGGGVGPYDASPSIGFRVATVPEPSALLIVGLASVGLLLRSRGRCGPPTRRTPSNSYTLGSDWRTSERRPVRDLCLAPGPAQSNHQLG